MLLFIKTNEILEIKYSKLGELFSTGKRNLL